LDSVLAVTQHEAIRKVGSEQAVESNIRDKGALINHLAVVGISDFYFGLQSTPPGGNGSVSNLEFFDLQKLSLLSFQPGSNLLQVPGIKDIKLVLPILNVTAPLGQRKNQQNQNALQHGLAFGSLTVPLDRNVVNQFGAFGTGLVGLSAEQQG
jgi:hypothetical protein